MTQVLFETVWANLPDGWAVASRAYARAMHQAGVDVCITSSEPPEQPIDASVLEEVGHLQVTPDWFSRYREGRFEGKAAYIFSTAFGGTEKMREPLRRLRHLNMPPRMLYTMFERVNVDSVLASALNGLDGVWVPCSSNKETLEAAGCTNVTWIPFPYFEHDPHLEIPSPSRFRTFYWIGRWEPRKAPDNLIRAFLRAFKPGESQLLLKLGPHKWPMIRGRVYEEPEQVVASEIMQDDVAARGWTASNVYQDVHVLRGCYSVKEMLELHASGDIYVSASRGEGIDLPAYTAKLSGRRVVTTDSGGPRDFLGEGDTLVPATGSLHAPEYEWLMGDGCRYADYSFSALVDAMQAALADKRTPARLPSSFCSDVVGKTLKEWIEVCSK